MNIPITKPVFGPEELRAVQRPLETGWVVQGPYVKAFEDRFASFARAPFAAATSSCTTALHLAVVALGLQPGDEVIVPALTWVSTPNVVEYAGARPVFCDIDPKTFNIDVDRIADLITSRTVGIMPVHLFGLCADMDFVRRLAAARGLWVVEDAACAFGARIGGRHAGTFGDAACFSFHPRKAITTGEGGMVTTARSDVHETVCSLRDHGASRTDLARHESASPFLLADYAAVGYNYRLTDIQGALGCAQMDRADWVLAQRCRVARAYDERLRSIEWLERPAIPRGYSHGYQSYVCWFRPEMIDVRNVTRLSERRQRLMARLHARGVATRPGTHAPVLLDYYRTKYAIEPDQFPNAWAADRVSLSLPLYPQMTDQEIDYVVDSLRVAIDE